MHEWSLTPSVQDFIPVVDSISKKVIHIDFPPRYKPKTSESLFDGTGLEVALTQATTAPPALEDDTFAAANRNRIPPPQKSYDFLPDLLSQNKNFKFRDDIKPLHILQPEGVSFKVDGHVIEWQKWKMHVGELPVYRLPSDLCLIYEQRSTIARVSHSLPSLTTMMASFGLSSTACLSRKWSFPMEHQSTRTLGSMPSMCE